MHMTQAQIDSLADDAATAAVALIQDRLGQTDGGLASMYFSGEPWDILIEILNGYIKAEINSAPWPFPDRNPDLIYKTY